jgi:hypothetical protein
MLPIPPRKRFVDTLVSFRRMLPLSFTRNSSTGLVVYPDWKAFIVRTELRIMGYPATRLLYAGKEKLEGTKDV